MVTFLFDHLESFQKFDIVKIYYDDEPIEMTDIFDEEYEAFKMNLKGAPHINAKEINQLDEWMGRLDHYKTSG